MTREQALACSLEWLEIMAAAATRHEARQGLVLLHCLNIGQGSSKTAWESKQRELMDRTQHGL